MSNSHNVLNNVSSEQWHSTSHTHKHCGASPLQYSSMHAFLSRVIFPSSLFSFKLFYFLLLASLNTPPLSLSLSLSLCSKWWLSKRHAGGRLQKRLSGLHVPRILNQPSLLFSVFFLSLSSITPSLFSLISLLWLWRLTGRQCQRAACATVHTLTPISSLPRRDGGEDERWRKRGKKYPMMCCPWGSMCTCRFLFIMLLWIWCFSSAQELYWRQGEQKQKGKHWMKDEDDSAFSIPLRHERHMASELTYHTAINVFKGTMDWMSPNVSYVIWCCCLRSLMESLFRWGKKLFTDERFCIVHQALRWFI